MATYAMQASSITGQTCATCTSIRARNSVGRLQGQRRSLSVKAQQVDESLVSRRVAVSGALAAAALAVTATPALAFLGFGENKEEKYKEQTAAVLTSVKEVLGLAKDDPTKLDKVTALRKETNDWVATYRRDQSFAGKPSYGNTYTALNALAGHFNSFGPTAPLPKKRLERVEKEVADAEKFLARGR